MSNKVITIENASTCTPYDLRQELLRREAMDIPEGRANYRSLLQRLMVELVKEQDQLNQLRVAEMEAKQKEQRDKLKEKRERRKLEALERFQKRRENDPDYFEKRKESAALSHDLKNTTIASEEQSQPYEENDVSESAPVDSDPFRSYQPKSRSKIFVK
jgi:hypothetical protein